jgi:UTP--glucose-1-phosphate uridylyltransferase
MDCSYVRQARSLGLGHAVLCAEPPGGQRALCRAAGRRPDDRPAGGPGVLAQMVAAFEKMGPLHAGRAGSAADQVRRYGIVAGEPAGRP